MLCCFVGHRDVVGAENKIQKAIEFLMSKGITEYMSGGMGNFDKMCEKTVKKLGGKIIFIPYNRTQVKEQDKIWYDMIFCPFGEKEYSKYDIPNRNKWMVDKSDICLCYVGKKGGAENTLKYALSKGKKIINLYMK